MRRLPQSVIAREELDRLLERGAEPETNIVSDLVERVTRLVVQELLEAEQTDFLGGRGRYRRRGDEQRGSRNGYERGKVRTAEGAIEVGFPQVRGAGETYRSALMGFLDGNSDVLDRLVTEMYARGLSTRRRLRSCPPSRQMPSRPRRCSRPSLWMSTAPTSASGSLPLKPSLRATPVDRRRIEHRPRAPSQNAVDPAYPPIPRLDPRRRHSDCTGQERHTALAAVGARPLLGNHSAVPALEQAALAIHAGRGLTTTEPRSPGCIRVARKVTALHRPQ